MYCQRLKVNVGVLMKDKIYLKIPAKSEYVGIVRLAISGIASRLDFSVEDIESVEFIGVYNLTPPDKEWTLHNHQPDFLACL